jgi:hypothetical protein
MRVYILLILFCIGLIWSVSERITFEKKLKKSETPEYNSLYREHNTLLIFIFAALVIDNLMKIIQ